jgi:enterochelin esterase-like enzyme
LLFSHVREDGSAAFHYPFQDARSVHVTGSFSDWQTPGYPLRRVEHGFYGEVPSVPMGDLEYKLIVDGRWIVDPQNLDRRGENSLLHRGHDRGSIHHLKFHSPALDEERDYAIYLPPGHAMSSRRFPVLYLLHGALDWEKTWIERGDLQGTMDRLRHEGAIGEMIVVMPRDNGDLYRGDHRFVDYLSRDLVGHVDYEFRTLADQRHRAIDGLSTGGFTSTILGAFRHFIYRSVGSMSGSHDPRSLEAVESHVGVMREHGQRYRVSRGYEEPGAEICRQVSRALSAGGVSVEHVEAPGDHDWHLWRSALPGHLCFHWQNVKG